MLGCTWLWNKQKANIEQKQERNFGEKKREKDKDRKGCKEEQDLFKVGFKTEV